MTEQVFLPVPRAEDESLMARLMKLVAGRGLQLTAGKLDLAPVQLPGPASSALRCLLSDPATRVRITQDPVALAAILDTLVFGMQGTNRGKTVRSLRTPKYP